MAGGRPATGSAQWNPTLKVWEARVTIPGVGRKPAPLRGVPPCLVVPNKPPSKCSCASCEQARRVAKMVSTDARNGAMVPAGTGLTVSEWFATWLAARKAKGLSSTADDLGRFKKWIEPTLGTRPIADVSRRDVESVVQGLDAAVASKLITAKTANNAWGVVSKMFSDACRSKVLELRVRDDNPARDVQGPDRGTERSGPYLFPSEFQLLMACRRVPPRWKRLIAIATCLGVRRGELAVLEWSSVHLDRGYVHVHQAEDALGVVKPTKTGDTRKVPIEPALRPLLERMHEMANGEGRVSTSMPAREDMAPRLRKYLEWACADAGVSIRAELLADDETRRPMVWHDLRHSYATWRAVRGDDPMKVQRACGHSDMATTQVYINEAETFEDAQTFGEPFPALDVTALTALDGSPAAPEGFGLGFGVLARAAGPTPWKTDASWRPRRDSNPTEDRRETSREGAATAGKTEAVAIVDVVTDPTLAANTRPTEPEPAPPSPSPRAAALADLYRHAATLAAHGDLAGARAVHGAITTMLGIDGEAAPVVDIASRRPR